MTDRREVWITGVGLLTCLGEGLEAAWLALERGDPPPYDDKTFAPYIVHPMRPMSFDKQIAKKERSAADGDVAARRCLCGGVGAHRSRHRRQCRIARSYRHDRLRLGGERDIAVDTAILTGMRKAQHPGAFLNERLMSDLRPTLFLAQLPNMLAGNISLVHGVVGASRTFLGEEAAGRRCSTHCASAHCHGTKRGGACWRRLSRRALGRCDQYRAQWHIAQATVCAGLGSRPKRRCRAGDAWPLSWCWKAATMREHAACAPVRASVRSFQTREPVSPAKSNSTLRRLWKAISPGRRSQARRHHLRCRRRRTGNVGGIVGTDRDRASSPQSGHVYRTWARRPLCRQPRHRLCGHRAW